MKLNEAIEKVLVESGLSISAFSRKIGYSRQYVYELMKPEGEETSRKIQLDTLKAICDATGYGLARLLADIGYIPAPTDQSLPHTIIVINRKGEKNTFLLDEKDANLVEEVTKALSRASQ